MKNNLNRQLPNDNFDKDQERMAEALKDSEIYMERLKRTIEEFKAFNRKAREYVDNMRKNIR